MTLTAQVVATGLSTTAPTGTVVFYDAGTLEIGQGTLSKGAATLTFVPDANVAFFDVGNGGEQNVTAQFTGSTDFASSTSNTEQLAVEQVTSAVSLAASPGFALVGQPITFVATVTNQMVPTSAPTGSVQFFDGSTALGTACCVPERRSGDIYHHRARSPDFIPSSAGFNPTENFPRRWIPLPAASDFAQDVSISPTGTSVVLIPSTTTTTYGQPLALTAAVLGTTTPPTGLVTFYDNGSKLGTAMLSGGVATLTTSTLAPKLTAYVIDAVYNGSPAVANPTSGNDLRDRGCRADDGHADRQRAVCQQYLHLWHACDGHGAGDARTGTSNVPTGTVFILLHLQRFADWDEIADRRFGDAHGDAGCRLPWQ